MRKDFRKEIKIIMQNVFNILLSSLYFFFFTDVEIELCNDIANLILRLQVSELE